MYLNKQCGPRSTSVSFGSTLFALSYCAMRHYGQTKICVFQVTFNIKIVTVGRELSFSLLKVFTWGRWGNNI